ncbi:MAG: hypothetical protein Q7W55_12265 [Pseudohongiella sp.]|nr:hypothetical protein [Pseudohongiella sp.]MDO9519416.1 hypothetical protein [Pseudohongiella sp.]MDP2128233.1 hypothetical protein [Pseudohongiella sp.]
MPDQVAIAPHIHARAALCAAVIAAAAFTVLEMILASVFSGNNPWLPLRMIAAIGMGEGVLQSPATFDARIISVALLIHLGLSVIFAFVFAEIARGRDIGIAIALGAAFGLIKYLISFYGMTWIFPWFSMSRGWATAFSHVFYGAVLGWVYATVVQESLKKRLHGADKPLSDNWRKELG